MNSPYNLWARSRSASRWRERWRGRGALRPGLSFEELAEVSVVYTECPIAMGCLAQVVDTVDIVLVCVFVWCSLTNRAVSG